MDCLFIKFMGWNNHFDLFKSTNLTITQTIFAKLCYSLFNHLFPFQKLFNSFLRAAFIIPLYAYLFQLRSILITRFILLDCQIFRNLQNLKLQNPLLKYFI